ncbi:hypothetical protein P8452_54360 [Trifolium repens]|nr:hypothetical protein P8452_54360 [Trifolium repens]
MTRTKLSICCVLYLSHMKTSRIVGYCLENKSENQVWSCLWLLPSHAWAWQAAPGRGQAAPGRGQAAPGRGHADIKCCFAFSDVLTGF